MQHWVKVVPDPVEIVPFKGFSLGINSTLMLLFDNISGLITPKSDKVLCLASKDKDRSPFSFLDNERVSKAVVISTGLLVVYSFSRLKTKSIEESIKLINQMKKYKSLPMPTEIRQIERRKR
jgi:hypothetical protein